MRSHNIPLNDLVNDTFFARLWAKVDLSNAPFGCWLWTGSRNGSGYAQLCIGGRRGQTYYAHRATYELFKGTIPDGLTIDHLCRVRYCVNPLHLEAVTYSVNVARGKPFIKSPTHCKQGHKYTSHNTRRRPNGSLYCRECNRAWSRQRRSHRAFPCRA